MEMNGHAIEADHDSMESPIRRTELREDLTERHVNMIAFSACIGVGLFLQSGKVIALAGPGLAFIAYLLVGTVVWSTFASLGEMTALFPVRGAIFEFPRRFIDAGVGFSVGWMSWFSWVVILASEILAVTQLWQFEFGSDYLAEHGYTGNIRWGFGLASNTSPAVWVVLFLAIVLIINFLPVLLYGELEYIFGTLKMLFIVGIIMFNIIINAKMLGRPDNNVDSHFWTYDSPYSFGSKNITLSRNGVHNTPVVVSGGGGRLLAMWTGMTTVVFSMIGFEGVAVTAAENKDLRKNETIKIATRKLSLRVFVLYTLCVFVGGLNVPYSDEYLHDFVSSSIRSGQHSVFILAAVRANLHGWPNFFNGFFIFSATTSGINSLYISSRLLHAMASNPQAWPGWSIAEVVRSRLERTYYGVPLAAVFLSWLFGLLAFMSVGSSAPQYLGRMATNSVVSMLIVYGTICFSYMRFFQRIQEASSRELNPYSREEDIRKYNRNLSQYPYRSHLQYLRAAYGVLGCSMFAIFNGWQSFVHPFSAADFFASYTSILVFLILLVAYRIHFDGWDPRVWRLSASYSLRNPMWVERNERRGTLSLPDYPKEVVTAANVKAIGWWVWEWLK